jgi:hypothetical protein
VTAEELAELWKAVDQRLRGAADRVAFVVDLTASTSEGATNKLRQLVTETLSGHSKPWGMCAGMGVVTETPCQDSFLRGVIASGPVPFPYRFFNHEGGAMTWVRERLRASRAGS